MTSVPTKRPTVSIDLEFEQSSNATVGAMNSHSHSSTTMRIHTTCRLLHVDQELSVDNHRHEHMHRDLLLHIVA